MKPELSEQLFIEELFTNSVKKLNLGEPSNLKIDKLTGDASTRRYYRLFYGERTFVACLDHPTKVGENNFVNIQQFLDKNQVRVPKIFDKNPERGYLLEEDLGNETLLHHLSKITTTDQEFEAYKKVIGNLIDLHSISQQSIKDAKIFDASFDFEKLKWEIEFTLDFYFRRFLNIANESDINKILQEFEPVCRRLSDRKMVLTHRDFHSRNIMISGSEFVTIDFQDARWGIPQYDLASLLDDCYYKINEDNKVKLKKLYFDGMSDLDQDFEEFLQLYDDMVLQRVFKAIGSFGYIYATRKDVRYIKYVGFAMEKIRKVMLKYPRYDDLRILMFKNYYAS